MGFLSLSAQTDSTQVTVSTHVTKAEADSAYILSLIHICLDKAKKLISRLVDTFNNDKVGLIVFAGDAFPLYNLWSLEASFSAISMVLAANTFALTVFLSLLFKNLSLIHISL